VEAGAISPHHGAKGGKAKAALGGGARGKRTGAREPRLAGAVVVMTQQGCIPRLAGWLMGVPLEVGGGSGSRPADPARRGRAQEALEGLSGGGEVGGGAGTCPASQRWRWGRRGRWMGRHRP
jgi:hypothetical protein